MDQQVHKNKAPFHKEMVSFFTISCYHQIWEVTPKKGNPYIAVLHPYTYNLHSKHKIKSDITKHQQSLQGKI